MCEYLAAGEGEPIKALLHFCAKEQYTSAKQISVKKSSKYLTELDHQLRTDYVITEEKAELHPFGTQEKSSAQWATTCLLKLLRMEGYPRSLCSVTQTAQRNSNHLHLQAEPKQHMF